MPKAKPYLVFAIIEIVLLPVTIVGVILFSVNFILRLRESRTSMTAYDPFFARYILHAQGKRRDEANKKLLYALPNDLTPRSKSECWDRPYWRRVSPGLRSICTTTQSIAHPPSGMPSGTGLASSMMPCASISTK